MRGLTTTNIYPLARIFYPCKEAAFTQTMLRHFESSFKKYNLDKEKNIT